MKRCTIIGCLWSLMASAMVHGNARAEIDYKIRYDSNMKQTYELRQKIQDVYPELIRGVHKESYIPTVLHSKELLVYRKDLQADQKQSQLVITEGDGKGDTITGALRTESMCVLEVQPCSLFQEIFQQPYLQTSTVFPCWCSFLAGESRIPVTWLNFIAPLFMCKYNKNRRMQYKNH